MRPETRNELNRLIFEWERMPWWQSETLEAQMTRDVVDAVRPLLAESEPTARELLLAFAHMAREHDTLVSIITTEDGEFVIDIGGGRIVDSGNADDTIESIMMCVPDLPTVEQVQHAHSYGQDI